MATDQQTSTAFGHGARPARALRQPPTDAGTLLKLTAAGLMLGGAAGIAVTGRGAPPSRASKLAAGGAALLAASVLADSAMEHYKGNYKKPAMHVAPVAAAITLATAVATAFSRKASHVKSMIFGGSVVTGLFGIGFHVKNILDRPGGLSFNNLFYRAPFGAPAALVTAGLAGLGAVDARHADVPGAAGRSRAARPVGRFMGAVTALGLFGLTAEVGFLHFRGAFHDKLMYAPVAVLPLGGLAVAASCVVPSRRLVDRTRALLGTTMFLGVAGTGLHAYGVSRNMGGFANWTQNLFQGPPMAAPPSLFGMGLLGLSALELLKTREEVASDV